MLRLLPKLRVLTEADRHPKVLRAIALPLTIVAWLSLPGFSQGQQSRGPYIVPPVDEKLQGERFEISRMLRNQRFENDEEREKFRRYYLKFALPRWAQPKNHDKLPVLRKELRNELRTGQSGEPHDLLNSMVLAFMQKVGTHPRVHPAVRVNALLMIGELNRVEVVRPGDLPVPLPEALPVLIQTLGANDQPEAVRAAAMVGLRYHAEFGELSAEARSTMLRTMLALVGSNQPPAEMSPDGFLWLRTRATQVLGLIGTAGENGSVARRVAALLADAEEPMMLRCAAAEALGRINYAGTSNIDVMAFAGALAGFAADAIREELEGMDKDLPTLERSRIKHRLLCAEYGLVGDEEDSAINGIVKAASTPDARAAIERYAEPIAQGIDVVDDKRMEIDEMAKQLEALLGQLNPPREQS